MHTSLFSPYTLFKLISSSEFHLTPRLQVTVKFRLYLELGINHMSFMTQFTVLIDILSHTLPLYIDATYSFTAHCVLHCVVLTDMILTF